MLKFFGGVSSAPDQTTPKASDQRNPFDFFTPSSRKGSVANQGGHLAPTASGGSSGTATAVPSGQATPAQRTSVSTPGVGSPAAASSSSGGASEPPATPGAVPPTPGGTVRSQPTTGASHALSLPL
ncbi:hypothetical protein JCM3775_001818 [Rhodotorula graminis]